MASQLVLLVSLLVIGVTFSSKPANANQMAIKVPDYKPPELKNAFLERQINSVNITRSSGVTNFPTLSLHNPLVGKDVKEKTEITDITRNMSIQNQDTEKVNISIGEAVDSKSASAHQAERDSYWRYKADYKLGKFPHDLFQWPFNLSNSKSSNRSSGVAKSTTQKLHSPLVGKDEKAKNESNVTTRNISMEKNDGEQSNIVNSQASGTPQLQMKKTKPSGYVSTVESVIVVVLPIGLLVFLAIFLIYYFYHHPEWLICYKRSNSTSHPEPAVTFENGKS
ncbi:unnamed protein product [Orchesella dallaii]|uniref:Uncharacterized protein n=1 Tax=Orchesella dallaii TaxID=48710 RepID=A0ABP1RPC1_9HEXA